MEQKYTDFIVKVNNPHGLDQIVQGWRSVVLQDENGAYEPYNDTRGYYTVRCFGDPEFVKFAINHQGYGKVVTPEEVRPEYMVSPRQFFSQEPPDFVIGVDLAVSEHGYTALAVVAVETKEVVYQGVCGTMDSTQEYLASLRKKFPNSVTVTDEPYLAGAIQAKPRPIKGKEDTERLKMIAQLSGQMNNEKLALGMALELANELTAPPKIRFDWKF